MSLNVHNLSSCSLVCPFGLLSFLLAPFLDHNYNLVSQGGSAILQTPFLSLEQLYV